MEDADGIYAAGLVMKPAQIAHLDMADFKSALNTVPQEQREALVLIGASGFSYDEAAKIAVARSAPSKAGSIVRASASRPHLGCTSSMARANFVAKQNSPDEHGRGPADFSSPQSR